MTTGISPAAPIPNDTAAWGLGQMGQTGTADDYLRSFDPARCVSDQVMPF
ncbi:MAG: hypothetical protein ACI8TP_004920 [Acidimicrobiales bacterium]|jgi:hypothetical protein